MKGTLEGYKPGQKNRAGSKRQKSLRGKGYSSKYQDSQQGEDLPQKRIRWVAADFFASI